MVTMNESQLETISLDKLDFLSLFIENELGTSESSLFIKSIIKENYLTTKTLSEATFGLVNRLFCDYGLLILDPNSRKLKEIMIPFFKNELFINDKTKVDRPAPDKNDYNKNLKFK